MLTHTRPSGSAALWKNPLGVRVEPASLSTWCLSGRGSMARRACLLGFTWLWHPGGRTPAAHLSSQRSPAGPGRAKFTGPALRAQPGAPSCYAPPAGACSQPLTCFPLPVVVRDHVHTANEVGPELLQVLRLRQLPRHSSNHDLLHGSSLWRAQGRSVPVPTHTPPVPHGHNRPLVAWEC